jgi:NAD(P)-dependent dehydrogenase (short-subunit alcohol dehydrogenase family)
MPLGGPLSGRRVLVTGSGRGIGREIAIRLAQEGAAVGITARSIDQVEETVREILAIGGMAVGARLDIASDGSVSEGVSQICQGLDGPIDTLVNNAGVYKARRFLDYSTDDWSNMLDINVVGMVRVIRSVLPMMLPLARARIINIASIAGKKASLGQAAYNASKHAQLGITRCLALELGRTNIRVNAVCPGFTPTDLIDIDEVAAAQGKDAAEVWSSIEASSAIGRTVTKSEIAALVAYLTSDGADGMNGQSLVLDGGIVFS